MAAISVSGLSKSFGPVEVFSDLELDVADGEFVALVGPSGCGKSTLLRIIAGLDRPSAGTVTMDGEAVNDLTPRERNIAMVFQSYALYPHMNVEENIAFNLRIAGVAKAERKRRSRETAALLGLTDLLARKPSQLSGGQRQRVAMGRALVRDPDAFLFDEPLSNLDAKLRTEMRDEIKRLHQSVRTTALYVTHDQIEAMTLADRIVIMNGGVIQQVGTPDELYNRPANAFVAGFIGSPAANFLDGRLTRTGEKATIHLPGTTIERPAASVSLPDGPVRVAIRPGDLHLAGEGEEAGHWTGTIRSIEPTGAVTYVKVDIAGTPLTLADTTLTPLKTGDPIALHIAEDRVMLFPAEGH